MNQLSVEEEEEEEMVRLPACSVVNVISLHVSSELIS